MTLIGTVALLGDLAKGTLPKNADAVSVEFCRIGSKKDGDHKVTHLGNKSILETLPVKEMVFLPR